MDITMSRVHLASDTCHIYFIHTKVNHLFYMCPLVPLKDGILLDPSPVCIHRYKRSYTFIEEESKKKRTSTPSKREAWKRRRKRQEEGSSSQAPPCAWAPSTPCPRASQAGGPEDPVHTGVYRTYGTPVSTGLTGSTYPVHTGPLCDAAGFALVLPFRPHLFPSLPRTIYTRSSPPFRLS